VTARAYPILDDLDDKMSEEEDTKEVKRKRTADRHSKEYSDKRKVENKEKTRPVLGALVSRKLAYLMKDWSMDTADQVLLEVMAQYPDPDKRKKRVKLEPSKPLKVDMKEEKIDINLRSTMIIWFVGFNMKLICRMKSCQLFLRWRR
jgi:hypothetical protein